MKRSCRQAAHLWHRPDHRLVLVPQPALLSFSTAGAAAIRLDARYATVVGGRRNNRRTRAGGRHCVRGELPGSRVSGHRGSPWNRVVADAMPLHLSRQLRQPYGFVSLVGSGGNFMTDDSGMNVRHGCSATIESASASGEPLATVARAAGRAPRARLRRPGQLVLEHVDLWAKFVSASTVLVAGGAARRARRRARRGGRPRARLPRAAGARRTRGWRTARQCDDRCRRTSTS